MKANKTVMMNNLCGKGRTGSSLGVEKAHPVPERDWREALGTSPDGAGQGKPELTEA